MSAIVSSFSALDLAVKKNQDTIVVEGDLANKVIRIKATGKVAWAVCIGCFLLASIALASWLFMPETRHAIDAGGKAVANSQSLSLLLLIAPVALVLIGLLIAFAGGGLRALNLMRRYDIKPQEQGKATLQLKSAQ